MSPLDPIRVMLVDDHVVVRYGFRMLLEASPGFSVVSEAGSGEQANREFEEAAPDVVVLDLSMPGAGGLETLRRLRSHHPDVRVLVLSAHEEAAYARHALKAGAQGYLTKRTAPEELIAALRAVAAGRMYLDATVARVLALGSLDGAPGAIDALSEREFTVFLELARGHSVNQIAAGLSLSSSTVGTHLYNIKQKLGAGNQSELTLIAIRNGLIEP